MSEYKVLKPITDTSKSLNYFPGDVIELSSEAGTILVRKLVVEPIKPAPPTMPKQGKETE